MAGTKKVMRTEVESGVIISTVMFTDTGVYQTMAFNNADETTEEQPTSFVVGGVYETPSICNSDCIFSYRVEKVTDKTVVIADKFGKTKRQTVYFKYSRKVGEKKDEQNEEG